MHTSLVSARVGGATLSTSTTTRGSVVTHPAHRLRRAGSDASRPTLSQVAPPFPHRGPAHGLLIAVDVSERREHRRTVAADRVCRPRRAGMQARRSFNHEHQEHDLTNPLNCSPRAACQAARTSEPRRPLFHPIGSVDDVRRRDHGARERRERRPGYRVESLRRRYGDRPRVIGASVARTRYHGAAVRRSRRGRNPRSPVIRLRKDRRRSG